MFAIQQLTESNNNLNQSMIWQQWEVVDGRPKLMNVDGTCEIALEDLVKKVPHFKIHSFVKKVQADYFENKKKSLSENSAVLQIDFAENYSMVSQDEIQSAHWNHGQISIFTCGVWLCNNVFKPYTIVSNDLSHNKYAVCVFLGKIIEEIKTSIPTVNHLMIFSDNCAGQFKNKFVMSNICHMKNDYGLEVEWNFFASGHGKGAVDGIGGNVKRCVWMGVTSRRVIVSAAIDFHAYVQKHVKGIKSIYVDKEIVLQKEQEFQKRWHNVSLIPKIQGCHHFRPYDQQNLLISKTSQSELIKVNICAEDVQQCSRKRLHYSDVYSDCEEELSEVNKLEVNTGLFVLVEVATESNKEKKFVKKYKYVGICQSAVDEEDDVKIMFLQSCGSDNTLFKPIENDVSFMKFNTIIAKLPMPNIKMKGDRVFYKFSKIIDVSEK